MTARKAAMMRVVFSRLVRLVLFIGFYPMCGGLGRLAKHGEHEDCQDDEETG